MLAGLLRRIFGTKNDREIKRYVSLIQSINALEPGLQGLSDAELSGKTAEFKARLSQGQSLDQILPEAFAVVREASKRVAGMRHFDVQLIGGLALHQGKIAEMKTGEGKTLTATAPVYLNALAGKGVHVVTVNDYLASRDAKSMGAIYSFLGLSTGLIVHGVSDQERFDAYHSDITYGTNNEFGFDYLRDNMKTELKRFVQRKHFFCIVDEVDSILIDEARTPLIISGPAETSTELYGTVNATIPGLQKDSDYIIDEKAKSVALTEDGISKLEKRLRVDNLYDPIHIDKLHHVQQAMKAHLIFKKDVDYVVRDNKVVIVDEFTGRLMPGRRYSDGLHGALEAKEHVPVENETQVLASITFQNFFRLYEKLSGMTGTADTEAVEFKKIYNLDVACIPPNRVLIRKDEQDEVYRTASEKFTLIADEIAAAQSKGQPVLVGTVSVEKSELLASLLRKRNIPHEVLNAKNHSREAQIIAEAGHKGHVTISTNMAGRGTDIVLGEGVRELGGLYVIGTERHESRRIDNQLRGRSGRQGDPGRSKFYLSLEDDLMRIFASDRLSSVMGRLGMQDGEAIVSPMVSRAIERAQRRVEEQNFSSRKHVLEYDDVMNQQRQVVYQRRLKILEGTFEIDFLETVIRTLSQGIWDRHTAGLQQLSADTLEKLKQDLQAEFHQDFELNIKAEEPNFEEALSAITTQAMAAYKDRQKSVGAEVFKRIEAYVYLQITDQSWKDHLRAMEALHDSVRLRGYAQRDPLQEYKREAYKLFEALMFKVEDETALALLRMPPPQLMQEEAPVVAEPDAASMRFLHADPATAALGEAADEALPSTGPDNMVYHGPRSAPRSAPKAPSPVTREMTKVGRNDPCPCGSGLKYKKCHGKALNPEG